MAIRSSPFHFCGRLEGCLAGCWKGGWWRWGEQQQRNRVAGVWGLLWKRKWWSGVKRKSLAFLWKLCESGQGQQVVTKNNTKNTRQWEIHLNIPAKGRKVLGNKVNKGFTSIFSGGPRRRLMMIVGWGRKEAEVWKRKVSKVRRMAASQPVSQFRHLRKGSVKTTRVTSESMSDTFNLHDFRGKLILFSTTKNIPRENIQFAAAFTIEFRCLPAIIARATRWWQRKMDADPKLMTINNEAPACVKESIDRLLQGNYSDGLFVRHFHGCSGN